MGRRHDAANPHNRFEVSIIPVQDCTLEERRMMKYFAIYWGEIMQHDPYKGIMNANDLRNTITAMLYVYYPASYWKITEGIEYDKIVFSIYRRQGDKLLVTLKAKVVHRMADN